MEEELKTPIAAVSEEEAVVTDGAEEANGDPLSIVTGSKPVFDVKVMGWDDDEELMSGPENEMRLVLAKNDKFYQRGLMELTIGDSSIVVNMDAILSCIYSVYETENPYRKYNPNKQVIQGYAVVSEKEIEETPEAPAHIQRSIKKLSFEDNLDTTEANEKKVLMLFGIEGVEEYPVIEETNEQKH